LFLKQFNGSTETKTNSDGCDNMQAYANQLVKRTERAAKKKEAF